MHGVRPRAPCVFGMSVSKKIIITGSALVFTTTTTYKWTPFFLDKALAKIIAQQINETALFYNVSIVGYVVMLNHLHLLLGLSKHDILPRFMQSFKSLSSRRIKISILRENNANKFKLWIQRYDDFVITTDVQFQIKLDYIHNNPVKQKLVDNPLDWEFSSAMQWSGSEKGLVDIVNSWKWLK